MREKRVMERHVIKEALDGGQTLISGLRAVATSFGRVFQVLQKCQNRFRGEVFQSRHMLKPALAVKILDQELERIAVAANRVEADGPLFLKIGLEEILQEIGQLHNRLKARRRQVRPTFPNAFWKRFSPSRRSASVIVR